MASYLPTTYQPNWGYSAGQQMYPYQQSMAQNPIPQTQQNNPGLIWVDGEVGAKAYQLPAGWPAGQPIALWDTNDTVIYLKSTNHLGMPNPLQKVHYKLETYQTASPMKSGDPEPEKLPMPDMTQYVKKEDLDRMKQELVDTIGQMQTSGTGVRKTTAKGE